MLEPYVVEGACVSDLDRMAEDFIITRGARPAFKGYMGFPATLCVSIDDAVVHGIPGDDVLKEGQEVKVKLLGFDDRGKTKLAMKMVDQETGEEIKHKMLAEINLTSLVSIDYEEGANKKELERIASKGYIELPSRLGDNLVFENKNDHIWWFTYDDVTNQIIASKRKLHRSNLSQNIT